MAATTHPQRQSAVGKLNQSQNTEPNERVVQSRDQVRMVGARKEPNHSRPSERRSPNGPRNTLARRNSQFDRTTRVPLQPNGVTCRYHWSAAKRATRAPVAGY